MAAPVSACPACDAAALAESTAGRGYAGDGGEAKRIMLSLPQVYCAACIVGVEKGLSTQPGVRSARVNLTLKRASIEADESVTAQEMQALVEGLGYEAHELDPGTLNATANDRAGRNLLMRLAVAGFASMNVMLLSVSVWSGAEDATRDMFHWISAAIALPTIAFSGQPFFVNAWAALKKRQLNMDVPITLAILLAVVTSLWETSLSGEHAYFDAALALTFFLLAGRYLDHRTRAIARSAAEELTALEVPRAVRLRDGVEQTVAVAELALGDMVLVRPGGRMPVDGEIIEGTSEIDRSLLTGETVPVFAGAGQAVSAGEVNLTGPLRVRATAVGADTSLHRMADLVAIAESGRSRYTSLADKAAKLYAPGVHILAGLAFVGWYLYTFDVRTALNIAAAVLIITCPCALGLAVPAVQVVASSRLLRAGVLVKAADALERLSNIDTVVFDKTGTLTLGRPELVGGDYTMEHLALAAALAGHSRHPLSRALCAVAPTDRDLKPGDIREVPGYGMEGTLDGRQIRLGSPAWCGEEGTDDNVGGTEIRLAVDGVGVAVFRFEDELRADAADIVAELSRMGFRIELLSGDTDHAVARAAAALGINSWQSGCLPSDKTARLEQLAAEGRRVLMVGDGLDDAPSLVAAHVSMSPSSAADVSQTAADLLFQGASLKPVVTAIRVARASARLVKQNFVLAFGYNTIAVPIAVAGLATPLVAAVAMSSSSIVVTLNALRLRWIR